MTYLRNYSRDELIALARERGIYPPENATDEELTVVERRLSAERGWIGDPQPTTEQRKHSVEAWAERHRLEGHHPHPAPTKENPERWECECPGITGVAVWRILTGEQIRQKFAHLKHDHPRRNLADDLPSGNPSGPPLRMVDRYAAGRPMRGVRTRPDCEGR